MNTSPLSALKFSSFMQRTENKTQTCKKLDVAIATLNMESARKPDEEQIKQFKQRLKYFSTYNYKKDTPQTIAQDLTPILPSTLSIQDIINAIFETRTTRTIPLFLDALLLIDPSFTLSLYDKMRRKIVEDTEYELTNHTLPDLFNEYGIDMQEEKLTACYDLAYRMNHPYIYCLSSTTISADAYTLNFLWINLNPQDRVEDQAQNIFQDGLDIAENAACMKNPTLLRNVEQSKKRVENWEGINLSFGLIRQPITYLFPLKSSAGKAFLVDDYRLLFH